MVIIFNKIKENILLMNEKFENPSRDMETIKSEILN